MTMTAARLYEIVKDVPHEAWPPLIYHGQEWYRKDDHFIISELRREPDEAETAFVGAMVKYLISKYGGFNVEEELRGFAIGTRNKWWGFYSTEAEALAAACKATKGGGE